MTTKAKTKRPIAKSNKETLPLKGRNGAAAADVPRAISDAAKAALADAQRMQTEGASWVEANNRLFGIGARLSQLNKSQRAAFFRTKEAGKITEILEQLPEPESQVGRPRTDVNGKILVRVPKSVHAALLAEAEAEGVSLNQLMVSKLSLQLRAAV